MVTINATFGSQENAMIVETGSKNLESRSILQIFFHELKLYGIRIDDGDPNDNNKKPVNENDDAALLMAKML